MSLAMDGRDGNVIGHGCRDGNVIGHGWPEWKCHWPPMAGMKMSLATDGRDGNGLQLETVEPTLSSSAVVFQKLLKLFLVYFP